MIISMTKKKAIFLLLFIFLLSALLLGGMGCRSFTDPQYFSEIPEPPSLKTLEAEGKGSPERATTDPDYFGDDWIMDLLGKDFAEIKEVLGEPCEEGFSSWLGPHDYMLYKLEGGNIRFNSPHDLEHKIAISIILGEGQKVLGVQVGMVFAEITDILGPPDFLQQIDDLYYLTYYWGDTINSMPEVYIDFSADSPTDPTREAFIKWEAYHYYQDDILTEEQTEWTQL